MAEGLRFLAEALTAFEASGRGDGSWRYIGSGASYCCGKAQGQHGKEAEVCFQQALVIARQQQAKSWELRAALSLSRLWQRQGKRAEAVTAGTDLRLVYRGV